MAIFCLIHIVCRHEYGYSLLSCLVDQVPKFSPRYRIDSACWLIKKNNSRLMKDRHRKSKLLLPSQWQGTHQFICLIFQPSLLKDSGCFISYELIRLSVYTSIKTHIFFHSQVVIKREFLAQIANILLDEFILPEHIKPSHGCFS